MKTGFLQMKNSPRPLRKTRVFQWKLDHVSGAATRTGKTPLVFAAMAKSYIIDRDADAAMRTGVSAAVVNIGDDIAVRGHHTEAVDIADPHSAAENSRRSRAL